MIKGIKYSAAVILLLMYLVFCGETAYYSITDKAYEEFNCIIFNKVYNSDELTADIQRLSEKYDCFGFFTIYDYSDKNTEINCCTNGNADKVRRKLKLKDCSFNTIVSGSFDISFAEFNDISTYTNNDFIIQAFYADGAENDINGFCEELKSKYEIEKSEKQSTADKSIYVGTACIIMLLLLNIYDVLNMKRSVCISLSLGNPLYRIILKEILRDTAVYAVSGILLTMILFRFTAVVLIMDKLCIYIALLVLINSLSYVSYYFVDICSSLKYENYSVGFMPISYILKFLSSCALILLLLLSGNLKTLRNKYNGAVDFKDSFSSYSRIELSESPYWARLIDSNISKNDDGSDSAEITALIDKEFEEQEKFLKLINEKSNVFLLNAFNFDNGSGAIGGRARNIIVSSDSAKGYIESQTGFEMSADDITILVPKKYNMGDLHAANEWVNSVIEEKGQNIQIKQNTYTSAGIAAFEYFSNDYFIMSDYDVSILDSPIVIYFPKAYDFGFFGYQSIQTDISPSDAQGAIKEEKLASLLADVSGVEIISDDYIRKVHSELTIYIILLLSCAFYFIMSAFSIIMLDIKINSKERAVGVMLGNNYFRRYIDIIAKIIISTAISGAAVFLLSEESNIFNLSGIIISTFAIMIIELLFLVIVSVTNERNGTVKILKGGAL